MKNSKKIIPALFACFALLTGCGQLVENMPDNVPVMNEQVEEQQSTETTTDITSLQTTATTSGYVAGGEILATTTGTAVTTTADSAQTTTTVKHYVAGGNTTVSKSGEQKGTTHAVPMSPTATTPTAQTAVSVENTTATETTLSEDEVTDETVTTTVTDSQQVATGFRDVGELMESMSLEAKVYQMFMVKPEQITGVTPTTASGETTRNAIKQYPVGGIVYFADNLVSVSQTRAMLENIQEYAKDSSGVGIFTAVDEEGGTVARAAQKLGTTSFYDMAYYGESNNAGTGYNIGYTIGSDLRSLGFNLDFAPVADVNINLDNELGRRIFSSDPHVVANMATAVATGIRDAGICATVKHFPGLGAEGGNTHNDSSVVLDRTVEQLRESEFIPFRTAISSGVDFVMVGHQIVTGFGDNLPSDLSYTAVTEYLRNELGFDGIAVTDSHMMNTITDNYSSGESAVMAVKAGIDIILMPDDLVSAVGAVCSAVENGDISEERIDESVTRILNRKFEIGLF
ncbi:MAG: glycoside hydrolase family 3 protein [Ruminococcus sp.]|nr:glycoside hydrolase family 3 protein [Ruminococcus sp.]